MEEQNIQYTCEKDSFIIKKNELSISEFYGHLQLSGCKVVLTIGKDLISRGISFVSNQKENPLTATTMIYKPGNQLSQVALTQAIGRLNGTAQPQLKRRLYTTDDVYSNYTTFVKNQREIMSAIRSNGNKVNDDLISDIALWKASRPVDRKTLKLEQDMTFWENAEDIDEDIGYTSDDDQSIRMKHLIDLWWGAKTMIGKILRFVYENENGVSEKTLKYFIESNGSKNVVSHYQELVKYDDRRYNLVFTRTNNQTNLTEEAREYIDNL